MSVRAPRKRLSGQGVAVKMDKGQRQLLRAAVVRAHQYRAAEWPERVLP